MTERPYVVLQGSVEIVAGENDVIIVDDGGADLTATVAPGIYLCKGDGDADDLLQAVVDALDAASARTWGFTFVAKIDPENPGIEVTFTSSASSTLQWTDGSTTFPWEELGFLGNSTGTSHPNGMTPVWCWVADQPMRLNKPRFDGDTVQQRMGGGQIYSTERGGPWEERDLWFEGIDGIRTLYALASEDSSTMQDSFQTWWELHRDGRHFRLEFARVSSGYTLEARANWASVVVPTRPGAPIEVGDGYNWVLGPESCNAFEPDQPEVGMELYSWRLRIRQYVE